MRFKIFIPRLITLAILLSGLALAKHPKIAHDLENVNPESSVDVIVQFKDVPTERHHRKVEDKGGRHKSDLSLINAGHYAMPAKGLDELASDPDVVSISPDRRVKGLMDQTAAAVNAAAAQSYGLTGTGIGIAVLDSGVTNVPDLRQPPGGGSRIVYSQDFTGQGVTDDNYGHGTHVAGIIAGNAKGSNYSNATRNLRGIAPEAKIINLRVLDNNGEGSDSAVIAAIQTAIQLKSKYNIRVMNLSLGRAVTGSYTLDPLCQAVEQAWKAGIVVVVAAGNDGRNNNGGIGGYGTINAPGNDPYVITVGAMKAMDTLLRSDDRIASYSSKGPTLYDHLVKPDILAPGNHVRSLLSSPSSQIWLQYPSTVVAKSYYMTGYSYTNPPSQTYMSLSGTSMATPVVSGAAALLIQQNPLLTPDQVKARLMKTAYKFFPATSTAMDTSTGKSYTSQYDLFTVGAGYLDIAAALANNDVASAPALSPAIVQDAVAGHVKLVQASNFVWGSNLVWGTNVVWGTSVVSPTSLVWGTGIVWGTANTAGTSIVWGTGKSGSIDPATIVWGTSNTLDAMNILTIGEN